MEGTKKKSIFKRWWFWVIVVVVVLGAIGNAGNKDKKDVATQPINAKETSQPAPKKEEPKEEAPKKDSRAITYEKFMQVNMGMSYEQVKSILGEGKESTF
ncbi:hypothetical protein [Clostridium sp. DJ247]|uniref:hypothetical protein n=1 Tax=Clostridium sp. DJ247 TaxID=2726188 RepID=UPI001628F9DB|nr:hypothetical protein [Clostridium sp. DJ247]MBC2578878.1 hypothetical protein [Clostridium sp. DJ247]